MTCSLLYIFDIGRLAAVLAKFAFLGRFGPRRKAAAGVVVFPEFNGLCAVTTFYRRGLIKGRETYSLFPDKKKTSQNQSRMFSMLQYGPHWLVTDGGIAPPRPLHSTFLHQSRLSPLRLRLGLRCIIPALHSALGISAWNSA